jgi:hypothetical protein
MLFLSSAVLKKATLNLSNVTSSHQFLTYGSSVVVFHAYSRVSSSQPGTVPNKLLLQSA